MANNLTRARWAALGAGSLAVAALPALLLWNVVRPRPWDEHTLRVRFESVRYEGLALVFTYSVENRAWRSLRLFPEQTDVRLVQSGDHIPAGFPSFRIPVLLEGHCTQPLELRIELPSDSRVLERQPFDATPPGSAGAIPAITANGGLSSPLPPGPVPTARLPQAAQLDHWIEDTLRDLSGFELINTAKGVHLSFPRGW
jgi:hypothetical protein